LQKLIYERKMIFMKKTLAIVLALAMVLVMSVSVFAAEKPADATDTDAWTAYYTELLSAEDVDTAEFVASVVLGTII
jgi:hypothetical protein